MVHLADYSYGKDLVRILRVVRDPHDASRHQIAEYIVRCLLRGPLDKEHRLAQSYTHGDNSLVVATDSVKNTLNVLAKVLPAHDVLVPERFALAAAAHFLGKYAHLTGVDVSIHKLKWSRVVLPDGPHKHSFLRDGSEIRTVYLEARRGPGGAPITTTLQGGLKDLLVLKSTGSAFHGFYKDEFTTLVPVNDRIFSTSIDMVYSFNVPARPIGELLSSNEGLTDFDAIAEAAKAHTVRVFATDNSASVQATMFTMASDILNDTKPFFHGQGGHKWLEDVEYALPNKHYVPVDLSFKGLSNTHEKDAEVFLPQQHPSGLIRAKISRQDPLAKSKL